MVPKRSTVLLLLFATVISACDFDLLVETLYDDYGSDEDDGAANKPNSTSSQGTTPAPQNPTGGSTSASTQASSQSTSASTTAGPSTNSVTPASAPRESKARRHRKKRKHVIGRIVEEKKQMEEPYASKLYANVDQYAHRYAPNFPRSVENLSNQKDTVGSGRNLHDVYDNNSEKEDENDDENTARLLTPDNLFGLLQINDDDDATVTETGRSSDTHQNVLLKLLIAEMEENAKMQKNKRLQVLKQKQKIAELNKNAFEFLLKLVESSWKKKEHSPGVSQHVLILMSDNKKLQDKEKGEKFDDKIKCQADKDNYVTCLKDQTIYETVKLNPKDNSGIRKVDESIRYSTIKDSSKMKESLDHVFKDRNRHGEYEGTHGHEPYPYKQSNRHQDKRPYDDDYDRDEDHYHRRPYVDTSSRFNSEDKDKESADDKSSTISEAVSSSSAIESTSAMPVSEKS